VTTYQPDYYQSGQGYHAAPRPGTSGLAITAFVLGLLGLWPLAPIFAMAALVQLRRSYRKGKGLAIAGLVLSLLWAVAQIGFAILVGVAVHKTLTQPLKPGEHGFMAQLRPGDCYDHQGGATSTSLIGRLCTDPHDGQMILTFSMPDGPWPGRDEVSKLANTGCKDRVVAEFAGHMPARHLGTTILLPTQVAWVAGDRTVHCALHTSGAKLTKTLLPTPAA
jgi:hypothetical protein